MINKHLRMAPFNILSSVISSFLIFAQYTKKMYWVTTAVSNHIMFFFLKQAVDLDSFLIIPLILFIQKNIPDVLAV